MLLIHCLVWLGAFLNLCIGCILPAGCHAVCVRVQGHRAGRRAAVLVLTGGQEGVFCCLLVHLLWPAAAWRGAGDHLEAQHHGLFYAILHSGHEGVPQQGGSATSYSGWNLVNWGHIAVSHCYHLTLPSFSVPFLSFLNQIVYKTVAHKQCMFENIMTPATTNDQNIWHVDKIIISVFKI